MRAAPGPRSRCAALGIGLLGLARPEAAAHSQAAAAGEARAWLGNLLVFGAVVCEASYAVIGKKLTGVLGPKRITSLINLWGFALVTPLGIWAALRFDFTSRAGRHLAAARLLFAGRQCLDGLAVDDGAEGRARGAGGVFTVMLPVSAAAVGVLVLGEPLGGLQLLAFALALAGVVLATLPVRARM